MIATKTAYPQYYRRTARRYPAEEESEWRSAIRLHFRKDGAQYVCAEGWRRIGTIPDGARGLISAGKELYYLTEEGLALFPEGDKYCALSGINALVPFVSEEGERRVYAVTDGGLWRTGEQPQKVSAQKGACGAVHYERLFTASGDTVFWSVPLNAEDFSVDTQAAGWLKLPSEQGDVIAAESFKDKLYLFREHGITQLRAMGDNLNFRALPVPYAGGKIIKESIVNCGDKIIFCTKNGVYSFNGGTCTPLYVGYSQVDTEQSVSAAFLQPYYRAAVTLREGERCLLCINAETGKGHFARLPAEAVGADLNGFYYLYKGALYRITECGLPPFADCRLQSDPSLLGLSTGRKLLDALVLEGEGYFKVTVLSETGNRAAVKGRAGERLVLHKPLAGNSFAVRIESGTIGAKVRAVVYSLREEKPYGY